MRMSGIHETNPAMNFRTLDLNLLRVFDAVMAERNLTRAAEQLAMTQPAVSNALRRLREALGDQLLVRSGAGMVPTPRADALWPEVRDALARLRELIAPDKFDPAQSRRVFRLAMADVTAATLMPAVVQRIERANAQINLRLVPLTSRDPRPLLDRAECDLAVGYFPDVFAAVARDGELSPLRRDQIYESEYVCVMSADHPLARPGALTLDAYCAAHHLLVSFSGRAHGFVDEALAAAGRQRRIMLTVNQFFTGARVVASSDLLTLLPRTFVPTTGFADRLAVRPLPIALERVSVESVWHARNRHDPALAWLRGVLVEAGADVHLPEDLAGPEHEAGMATGLLAATGDEGDG